MALLCLFGSPAVLGLAVVWHPRSGLFGIPRPLRISAEGEPPDLSLWSFAYFVGSAGFPAWLPCPFRKLSVFYFYTAELGGDPLLLCEDGALTFRIRGGILVSSRIPCALGGQASTDWGFSSLSGFIIAHFFSVVKTFF